MTEATESNQTFTLLYFHQHSSIDLMDGHEPVEGKPQVHVASHLCRQGLDDYLELAHLKSHGQIVSCASYRDFFDQFAKTQADPKKPPSGGREIICVLVIPSSNVMLVRDRVEFSLVPPSPDAVAGTMLAQLHSSAKNCPKAPAELS